MIGIEHRQRAGIVEQQARAMNTDTVEWHFGNATQMVGGSTSKLTAAGFTNADKKASTFNMANMAIVGNNSPGANVFASKKKY
jgi:hypothetical protein